MQITIDLFLLKLFLLTKYGRAEFADDQNLDNFDDELDLDSSIDELADLLEQFKRKLKEIKADDNDEFDSDECDTNPDALDKWNGLDSNPDYVHPEFHDFLPSYYKVSTKYYLSDEPILGSQKTMYDTGANINVMNKQEFDRINKIEPLVIDSISKKPSVTQGDGSKMRGYLGTTHIRITVSDSDGNTSNMVRMKFYVFRSIGDIDVIIGRHFMKEASIENVIEYPQTHSIKFSGSENNNSDLTNGVWFCLIIVVLMIFMRNSNQGRIDDEGNYVAPPRPENPKPESLRRRRRIAVLGDVYADEFERRKK